MKRMTMLSLLTGAIVLLCGCNKPTEISGAAFTTMLKRPPETMRSTQYVGISDGKAVLKVSKMSLVNKSKWNDTYFVTPVDNLPKDFPYPIPVPQPIHERE